MFHALVSEAAYCTLDRSMLNNICRLESVSLLSTDNLYANIESNGYVNLWNAYSVTIKCTMDIAAFPFDTQTCVIDGTQWMYSIDQIHLKLKYAKMDLDSVATVMQFFIL